MLNDCCGGPGIECLIDGELMHVRGEIDLNTAPVFYEALVSCSRDTGKLPTIDFKEVTYFDSSGVQALLDAVREESDKTEPVKITGVRPHVLQVMRIVGLQQLFELHGQDDSNGYGI